MTFIGSFLLVLAKYTKLKPFVAKYTQNPLIFLVFGEEMFDRAVIFSKLPLIYSNDNILVVALYA